MQKKEAKKSTAKSKGNVPHFGDSAAIWLTESYSPWKEVPVFLYLLNRRFPGAAFLPVGFFGVESIGKAKKRRWEFALILRNISVETQPFFVASLASSHNISWGHGSITK